MFSLTTVRSIISITMAVLYACIGTDLVLYLYHEPSYSIINANKYPLQAAITNSIWV